MTCKKKRLKCDEIKPSCAQCAKRNVVCEGYRKDYKWRSFEEQSFNPKPVPKAKKNARASSFTTSTAQPRSIPNDGPKSAEEPGPSNTWSPGLSSAFADAAHAFKDGKRPGNAEASQDRKAGPPTPGSSNVPPYDSMPGDFADGLDPYSLPDTTRSSSANDGGSGRSMSTFSGGSPHLSDLLLPGTDLNRPPDPSELRPPPSPHPYSPAPLDSPDLLNSGMNTEEEFDEEVNRQRPPGTPTMDPRDTRSWNFRLPSPVPSEASAGSPRSPTLTLLPQPQLEAASPEMLMLRFDKATCGILSVKDGPNENPWRTLIWPLARDSPALYHAISSMTAFHGAFEIADLHVPGMAHMTKSIKKLATEIDNMRLDSALATSLALAFGEGWDRHVSTGIQHLHGARIMVNNAVMKHRRDMQQGRLMTQDAMRLKFLCNTFVYMDVIARLSSLEDSGNLNLEEIIGTVNQPMGDLLDVDPLMGCAVTLFPIIGRAASLIQTVRRTSSNGLAIVSKAMELKEELQQWQAPSSMIFERPEDRTSEVQHSIQTADAYRYAMILYLHQAVPEIPCEPCEVLAKKVLMALASVPLSSRAIIVQIFPLLAAGCEATTGEDRQWVSQRWNAMLLRLKIGNVLSCMSVVQEVWSRYDAFEAEKKERMMRRARARGLPNGDFVPSALKYGKRKAHTNEASTDDAFFGEGLNGAGAEQEGRPPKVARRVTFENKGAGGMPMMGPIPLNSPGPPSRRTSDIVVNQLEPEYTVRGRLHWLGVMQDWQWEGMFTTTFFFVAGDLAFVAGLSESYVAGAVACVAVVNVAVAAVLCRWRRVSCC